jgi:hypothetical protein
VLGRGCDDDYFIKYVWIYLSYYFSFSTYEHNGEKKNMAVTEFEPAGARRCFPCWDEPACKVFAISLSLSLG